MPQLIRIKLFSRLTIYIIFKQNSLGIIKIYKKYLRVESNFSLEQIKQMENACLTVDWFCAKINGSNFSKQWKIKAKGIFVPINWLSIANK